MTLKEVLAALPGLFGAAVGSAATTTASRLPGSTAARASGPAIWVFVCVAASKMKQDRASIISKIWNWSGEERNINGRFERLCLVK